MSDEPTYYTRTRRDDLLDMARKIFPDASDQRLMELLHVYTKFPFGDADEWQADLKNHQRESQPNKTTP